MPLRAYPRLDVLTRLNNSGSSLIGIPCCKNCKSDAVIKHFGTSSDKLKGYQRVFSRIAKKYCARDSREQAPHVELAIPTKWEKIGDCVLFHANAFQQFQNINDFPHHQKFWEELCISIPGCRAIGLLGRAAGDFRSTQTRILYGETGIVRHRENGISYYLDPAHALFSSGNASERHRLATLILESKRSGCSEWNTPVDGEVIVDMFCGIGYFTLPIFVRCGNAVREIWACDWNQAALKCLKRGVEEALCEARMRSVETKLHILEGDSTLLGTSEGPDSGRLRGCANRICLGLLPSSEAAWAAAARVANTSRPPSDKATLDCSSEGSIHGYATWLHVHGLALKQRFCKPKGSGLSINQASDVLSRHDSSPSGNFPLKLRWSGIRKSRLLQLLASPGFNIKIESLRKRLIRRIQSKTSSPGSLSWLAGYCNGPFDKRGWRFPQLASLIRRLPLQQKLRSRSAKEAGKFPSARFNAEGQKKSPQHYANALIAGPFTGAAAADNLRNYSSEELAAKVCSKFRDLLSREWTNVASWTVEARNIQFVKSYSARFDHYVFDILCVPKLHETAGSSNGSSLTK